MMNSRLFTSPETIFTASGITPSSHKFLPLMVMLFQCESLELFENQICCKAYIKTRIEARICRENGLQIGAEWCMLAGGIRSRSRVRFSSRISGPTLVRVTDRLVISAKGWTLRARLAERLGTSIYS